MTEAKWLGSTTPQPMLAFVHKRASPRKLRYYLVACAQNVLPVDADTKMIEALAAAEKFADGEISKRKLGLARSALQPGHRARLRKWPQLYTDRVRSVPAWHATNEQLERALIEGSECCAWSSTRQPSGAMAYPTAEFKRQTELARDIFGNPFQIVDVDPEWRTSSVISLARQMYQSHDFSRMPILSDALLDAGCDRAMIIDHCRSEVPHVRGCWVIDLLLGKE